MIYGKDFFDLQLEFARGVSALSGMRLSGALLVYTNLYVRFGLGRDFDAEHPAWRAYLAGVERAGDARDWTYAFYLTRTPDDGMPPVMATVGCFSYARWGDSHVRLHFQDAEADGDSPLAADRRARRRAELRTLFAEIRRSEPAEVRVAGTSWLYNIEAYRGLFPQGYLRTARPAGPRFRNMSLWGQFLDRKGELRPGPTAVLRQRLAAASGLEGVGRCFPLQVLALDAPLSAFEGFYAA